MILDFIKKIDWVIILCSLPIMIIGMLTMSNLSSEVGILKDSYFVKQSFFILLFITVFIIFSFFDYRFLRNSSIVTGFYFFSLILLILLFPFGYTVNGSKAWFDFGLFSFEPSDLMKIGLIALFAKYFSKRHIEIANFKHIVVSFIYMFIPFILIVKQPDLGSALVLLSIWLGMVFVSGISKKHLLVIFATGVIGFIFLWNFYFKDYQKARIITFINPNYDLRGSGYNVYQSIVAAGSGGLYGKGLGYGTQSRLNFLPEHETDFIFASFLEEWGFLGGVIVFILIIILMFHLTRMSIRAESNFEALFILGVVAYLMTHITINMGMNIGLLPVTGIPLPFMSYGGTHLLIEAIALGICAGMSRYSKASHKSKIKNEFLGLE